MGLFDSLFRRKNKESNTVEEIFGTSTGMSEYEKRAAEAAAERKRFAEAAEIQATLPEGQLMNVSLENDFIDTTSPDAIARFKHNLGILMQRAEQEGKVNDFRLIREDDFFPEGWEWDVLSRNTNVEKKGSDFTVNVLKEYAREQAGIDQPQTIGGIHIPSNSSYIDDYELLSRVDKTISLIATPCMFRSTKHFTVNTPLEATGSYNNVKMGRNFTVIDGIDNFINSGYAYSLSHRDAYLDVSHESLPISEEAVVLIAEDKFSDIIRDEKVAAELSQRRVLKYKGDLQVAVGMVLAEMGVLPSSVNPEYAKYSDRVQTILEESVKKLAEENNLSYEQSHSSISNPEAGHFSDFYDRMAEDHIEGKRRFSEFLVQRFPEFPPELFELGRERGSTVYDFRHTFDIIEQLGVTDILDAISEFNNREIENVTESRRIHKEQRNKITPEEHKIFTSTVAMINEFYKNGDNYYDHSVKDIISKFFHSDTPTQQLEAARQVQEFLISKDSQFKQFTMETATRHALTTALPEDIKEVDETLPQIEQSQEQSRINEGPEDLMM